MKIAIVVPYIHEGGGVPKVAQYFCDIFSNHECQIISLSTSLNDKFSVRLTSPKSWFGGIKISYSTWESRKTIDVGAFLTELEFQRYMPRKKLTRLLNEYDVVQIIAGTPAVAYAAKNTKKPVFLQVATLAHEERHKLIERSNGFRKLYLKATTAVTSFIEKKALKRVDLIFVENYWLKDKLEKQFGSEKIIMAPPGIDTKKFAPREPGDNLSKNHIISVGRFNDRRKNTRLLFESYLQIRNTNPSAPKLILVGLCGPTDDDWLFAEKAGIKSHIVFKKNVAEDELVQLLQDADLFVCSSDEEGLGIAMLEALACGTPVVSTRCGGPETFIQDGLNGFLVQRNSPLDLADKVNYLLTNNQIRLDAGKAAREIINTRFSNNVTALTFIDSYEKFLQKR